MYRIHVHLENSLCMLVNFHVHDMDNTNIDLYVKCHAPRASAYHRINFWVYLGSHDSHT